MSDEIRVAVTIGSEPVEAGTAYFHRRRKSVTTTFTYDTDYLANPAAYAIDPALPLDTGRGYVDGLPGAFADCAPDRWGRGLITRRIRAGEPAPRQISDVDYLLGVSDVTRQGALRFRRKGDPEFAHPAADVPKLVRLPELLAAADHVARDDEAALSEIKILLDAGTGTLGGARPKASVTGDDGLLYIAKFPHHHDRWNVMAWEKTALDLAEQAGIAVPGRRLTQVGDRTVLLLERFDRRGGERIGYWSAMTLGQGNDGGDHDYLDLAADLTDHSAAADEDLEELWRRAAFSVAIHNTDDHFRNHGVLRAGNAWRLSPAFDLNPNPDLAEQRTTGIGGVTDRRSELPGLRTAADAFGIRPARAREILTDVSASISRWREVAASNGVPEREFARFAAVFDSFRDDVDAG
ncbi:type II toxin-antitoxin system HipA family toxin [Amycolatopsis jejuensis]|uniref:type II toxin-antitoxin system HipA family toxin n=1 Tax=Amycolatopsis jejuensis TaxID=330084 RepID=UPI0007C57E3A|nr:HipA domain-containing protein [Amycolatopsis jejuensis]